MSNISSFNPQPHLFVNPFNMRRGEGSGGENPSVRKTTIFALSIFGAFLSHWFLPKDIRGTISILSISAGVLYSFCGCTCDRVLNFISRVFSPPAGSNRFRPRLPSDSDDDFGFPPSSPSFQEPFNMRRGVDRGPYQDRTLPHLPNWSYSTPPQRTQIRPNPPAATVVTNQSLTDVYPGQASSGPRNAKKTSDGSHRTNPHQDRGLSPSNSTFPLWEYTPPPQRTQIRPNPPAATVVTNQSLTDVYPGQASSGPRNPKKPDHHTGRGSPFSPPGYSQRSQQAQHTRPPVVVETDDDLFSTLTPGSFASGHRNSKKK